MNNDAIIGMLKQSVAGLTKATTELGDSAMWSPLDKGRTAVNQVGECALIAGMTAKMIEAKAMPPVDMSKFGEAVAEIATSAENVLSLLATNVDALCAAVAAMTEADHAVSVTMPWGQSMTLTEVAMLNYWNNTYHEGQINYIATLLA
jgi:hypothetical protein